jgi:hypothetical protein
MKDYEHMQQEADRLLEESERYQMEALIGQELHAMLKASGAGPKDNLVKACERLGGIKAAWTEAHRRVLDRLSWKP